MVSMLSVEQAKLVEDNHNLIYWFMNSKGISEDYYGDIAIGLIKAVQSYDSNKGNLSTLAYKCMNTEYLSVKRRESTLCRGNGVAKVSLNNRILDEDGLTEYIDMMDDGMDYGLNTIEGVLISERLGYLSLKEIKILYLRLCGLNMEEIGKVLNVTRERIRCVLLTIADTLVSEKPARALKMRVKSGDEEEYKEYKDKIKDMLIV